MLEGRTVGVVVPAYNEERLIGRTLSSMPAFVDKIIVIDDGSMDRTKEIVLECMPRDSRIEMVHKPRNEGLGKAIADGYARACELGLGVTAVMAGDGQMDPGDLGTVVSPVLARRADYVKGNRLLNSETIRVMPIYRFVGNSILSILTKFATGYFNLIDPQCGYTAIGLDALRSLDPSRISRAYGYNASILYQLNLLNAAVIDVRVKAVYGDAVSGIRLRTYVPTISWRLVFLFFKRVFLKYFVLDFHPVGLCYSFGLLLSLGALYLAGGILSFKIQHDVALPPIYLATLMLFILCSFGGMLMWLFAILLDIEYLRTRRFMN